MSEDGYTRITLRIPDGLHVRLTSEAARTSKSMNAEIVARLEGSFAPLDASSVEEILTASLISLVRQGIIEFAPGAAGKLEASESAYETHAPPATETSREHQIEELFAESERLRHEDLERLHQMNELQAERDSRKTTKARKDAIHAELARIHAERKGTHEKVWSLLDQIGDLNDSVLEGLDSVDAGSGVSKRVAAKDAKPKR